MLSAQMRIAMLAFVGSMLLSGSWALSNPIMLTPDEASHTIRAVSLWEGELLGDRFELVEEGPPRVEAINFAVDVPAGYRELPTQTGCFQDPAVVGGCGPTLRQTEGTIRLGTSAGAYQPLWYWLLGAPSTVLAPVPAIYAGRLLQVIAGSVFLALTMVLASRLAGRGGVAVALLGVTPTAAWIMGAINPNGLEIVAATTLWLGLLALVDRPDSRWLAWTVGVAAVGVAWARPFSPLITLGIVAAVLLLTVDRHRATALWRAGPARAALIAAALAVGSSMAWNVATGALDTFIGRPDPTLTPGVAAGMSWSLTSSRLEQMVGRFGLINIPLPAVGAQLWAAAVIVVVIIAMRRATLRQLAMLVSLAAATVGLPVLAEALTASEYGLTWQGRYSMPIAYGLLAVVIWVLAHDRPVGRDRAGWWLASTVAVVLPVVHITAYLVTITTVSVGPGRGLTDYLTRPGWSPPGPDLLLLLTLVGGVGVLLCTLLVPTVGQTTMVAKAHPDD